MPNYKITFLNNAVLRCKETTLEVPAEHAGNVYYHHDPGTRQLIFAVINARSEVEAMKDAGELIEKYTNKGR